MSDCFFFVGNEDTPHAQPIPSVTVGYGGDWMSLSPIALQFWVSFMFQTWKTVFDVTSKDREEG